MKRFFMIMLLMLVTPMSHAHTALAVGGNGTVTKADGTVVPFAKLLKTGEINNFQDGDRIKAEGSNSMLVLKMDDNKWCKITHDQNIIIQGGTCIPVNIPHQTSQVVAKENVPIAKATVNTNTTNDSSIIIPDKGLSESNARLNVSFLRLLQSAQEKGLVPSVDTKSPDTLITASEQLRLYIITKAVAEQSITKSSGVRWTDKKENVFLLSATIAVFIFIVLVIVKALLYKPTEKSNNSIIKKPASNQRKYFGMRRALNRLMSEDPELAGEIIRKIQERSKPPVTRV